MEQTAEAREPKMKKVSDGLIIIGNRLSDLVGLFHEKLIPYSSEPLSLNKSVPDKDVSKYPYAINELLLQQENINATIDGLFDILNRLEL